jgi:hypothetical protein
VNGADLGNALARGMLLMLIFAVAIGIALAIGGWALWHFFLSHIHWSWS